MSLVELMASLVIVLVVMAIATSAYLKLIGGYKAQGKMAESYMSNLCGLELLRYDIEMAGHGLPYDMNGNVYSEASEGVNGNLAAQVAPKALNDAPNIPGAFSFSNGEVANNTKPDTLAVKSTMAAINTTSRKWSYIYRTGASPQVKAWAPTSPLNPLLDFDNNERFIILDSINRGLQPGSSALAGPWGTDTSKRWCYRFIETGFGTGYYHDSSAIPSPSVNQNINLIYGVSETADPLRMPFNRVDYFLSRSSLPTRCDPGSYTLYRATINHGDGGRLYQPIIDCVRDFQIAFQLDPGGWRTDLAGLTVQQVREQVRQVRVFILFQEGAMDKNYSFNGTLNLGDAVTGTLSSHDLTGSHYRWKIQTMTVKPMNLQQ